MLAEHARTEWDLEAMGSVVTWLESTRDYVERLTTGMHSIMDTLGPSQDTALGGFTSATALHAQNQAVWQGVRAALQQAHAELGDAASATRKVIENYRTTEERNRMSAAEMERLLGAGPAGSAAPAVPRTGGPTGPTGPTHGGGGGSW